MLLLKSCVFLVAALSLAHAEVVHFQTCPNVDQTECTVNEVRIEPCPEATRNRACNIKRQKATKMSFDFTPNFDSDTLESKLAWVRDDGQELQLITFEKDGCKSTTCPTKTGVKQTYSIDVPIERKFPISGYTIKWTFKASDGKQCCFTNDIKVVH